ncbi:MAG TPA: hypothetical protein VJM09_04805 [Sphingobium sp.]|nr:hypothetical protein [Sphingobium sp.]
MSAYADLVERLQAGPAYPSTADKLARFLENQRSPAWIIAAHEAGRADPDPFYTEGTEQ